MDKLITVREDGGTLRFLVYDQEWTREALEELRREHGVYFRPDSVVGVMRRGKLLRLGMEDDGTLSFGPESPCFHVHWARGLAAELEEAAAAAENNQQAPE